MRRILLPVSIILCGTIQIANASPSSSASPATKAPITEVVLYPGSATIIRTIPVNAGKSQIELGGLPTKFDTQTLHAEASTGISIGSLVTKDSARTETISAGEAELEARIQTLMDQQEVLEADIHAQEIVKAYLERLGGNSNPAASDKSVDPGDAKRLTGVVDTIGRSGKDALLHIHTLTVQKREIQKHIDALNRDLARQHSGNDDARTVTISLNADKAGTVTLSYQVNNAGWKPTYRATLNSESSQLDLDRLAVISQRTGEDWTNVKMTLATSKPNLNPGEPDPQPWLLKYYPPEQNPIRQSVYAVSPVVAPAAISAARPVVKASDRNSNEASQIFYEIQSNYDTQFHVPARVDLLSDGREATVTLSTHLLSVKQFVQIAPRSSTDAILIARTDKIAGIWLNGQIQLIRDGNYVGATTWKPMDDEHFVFPFGRDSLIKVEKIDLKTDTGSTGFIEKKAQREFALQYVVTNLHKTGTDIELVIPAPVSTSEEITVKSTVDPKPTTDSWKNKRGVMAWNNRLIPGEAAKFTVNYEIGYPTTGRVQGM